MPNDVKIQLVIEAIEQNFDRVINKIRELQNTMRSVQQAAPVRAIQDLSQQVNILTQRLDAATRAMDNQTQAMRRGSLGMLDMQMNVRSFITDIGRMIQLQARWYAARALIFGGFAAGREVIEYVAQLDQARAELLRWEATSGQVSEKTRQNTERIMLSMRRTLTEYPLTLQQISESTQAFISAGVPYSVVADMVSGIAQLKSAFKEINFNEFAKAVTGAFNVFKDQLGEGITDAEKFQLIFDKILRAQAIGVIRPEEFTKVLQYMSETSKQAGFTLDQLLAMSVAITNTGINAASAGRLMSGLMVNLTSSKANEKLKQLSDEIGGDLYKGLDKDKNLAEQFDKIIENLRFNIGAGGSIPAGWMSFLEGLTREERRRVLVAFLDQYKEYLRLVKDIAGAEGGLTKAADIMKMTIPAQWQIFQNILREIGANALASEGALRTFMGVVNDIARGMLAAVDQTGIWADKLDNLGTAGKVTYALIQGIRNAFSALGDIVSVALKPFELLLSLLGKVAEWLGIAGKQADALRAYFSAMTGAVTGGLVGALLGAAGAGTKLALAFGAVRTAIIWLVTWGLPMLWKALGPIGRLLMVGNAIYSLFESLSDSYKESQPEYQSDKKIEGMKLQESKDLRTQLAAENEALAKLTEERDKILASGVKEEEHFDVVTGTVSGNSVSRLDREIEAKKKIINAYSAELKNREELQKAAEKTTGQTAPDIKGKKGAGDTGAARSLISAEKALAQAELNEIKALAQAELDIIQNQHKLGLKSHEEYYAEVSNLALQEFVAEQKVLQAEKSALQNEYKLLYAEADTPKKKEAVKKKELADLEALRVKEVQLNVKHQQTLTRILVEAEQQRRELYRTFGESVLSIIETRNKRYEESVQNRIQNERTLTQYLYENNVISAEDYYESMYEMIQREQDSKIRSIDTQFKKYQEWMKKQVDAGVLTGDKLEQAKLQEVVKFEQAEAQKVKIAEDASSQRIQLQLKELDDVKRILEKEDMFAVMRKEMGDIVREWTNVAAHLQKITRDAANGMADAMSDSFFKVYKGEIRNLKSFVTNFLDGIADAMARSVFDVIGKSLTAEIMRPFADIFKGSGIKIPGVTPPEEQKTALMHVWADVVQLTGVSPSGTPIDTGSEGWAPAGHPQSHTPVSAPTDVVTEEMEEGAEDVDASLDDLTQTVDTNATQLGIVLQTAIGRMFPVIGLINSLIASLSAMSASSSGGGLSSLLGKIPGLGDIFGGGGGGIESFGENELLTWAATAHTGRKAYGEFPKYRMVPSGVFAGAPRYHSGNLASNERAVIITDDEHVVPDNKVSRSSSDTQQQVQPVIVQFNVSTLDSASFGAYVQQNRKLIANAVLSAQGDNHRARRGR